MSSENDLTIYENGNSDIDEAGDVTSYSKASVAEQLRSVENIADTASNIVGMYRECLIAKEQTLQVQAWSSVEITKTIAKFKSAQDFMEKTFGERDKALCKNYSILDQAVATNDREMILAALHGISTIVTKSPLEDFQKFVDLYNDTSQPLLDF